MARYPSKTKKEYLRAELIKKDGTKCHYCKIEESNIVPIWGDIYGGKRRVLEVEHKDNDNRQDSVEGCVLACPICNIAKSNKFKYKEFKEIGAAIEKIWRQRLEATQKR